MTTIPDSLSTFVRFIQLRSLRSRTKEDYVRWVKRIAQHHGAACASLLSEEQVLSFVHHLQQNHDYEGSTLNQCVAALRLFFRDHLAHADWTCWQHIKIKRHEPIPTVLDRSEVRTLLSSVKERRFRMLFTLMYHCGLRLGEVCRLEVSHLDRKRGVLRVINGKGGKNREVPVSARMFNLLGWWWQQHRNPRFLFPGVGRGWKEKYGCRATAQRQAKHPMSDASVQQAMKAAILTSRLTKAGICCHALRHSYATHMLEEGVSVRQLQRYLGHASIEVTVKYLHLTNVSETRAQEALGTLYDEVIAGKTQRPTS
jgi:site-specific recombinase XerD